MKREQNEHYRRRANLEIDGLPVANKEDLKKKILKDPAANIDLPEFSLDDDVVALNHLSGKTDTIAKVLVRFPTISM